MSYVILSDSSCDLNEEIKNKYNLQLVPFYVSFDKTNYLKENIDISVQEFYKNLKTEKSIPKTSLPSMEDYISYFKPILEKGSDIICFTLSSELSGSYQSAINASQILLEEFSERTIKIIDSRRATIAQGLLVLQALNLQENGYPLEQVCNKISKIIDDSLIIFSIDTLEYLQKGGRIGKVSALAGTLLNIKPIILLKNGILEPFAKVRGRKKVLSEIINIFKEKIDINNIDKYDIAIAHSDSLDEAIELKNALKEKLGIELEYPIFDIGVTVGAHIGDTAIGIGFSRKA